MCCLVMIFIYELAFQVVKVFQDLGVYMFVKIMVFIGGVDQEFQIEAFKKGVDVFVAIFGWFFDLISQGYLWLECI